MSSRVSIQLVGFVAVIPLSFDGLTRKASEFELFAGSNRQTKSYNGNKADKSIEQVDQVGENVSTIWVLHPKSPN